MRKGVVVLVVGDGSVWEGMRMSCMMLHWVDGSIGIERIARRRRWPNVLRAWRS